ncbi:hypothetical protein T492DRAFT_635081 [Pavlovales sp. CCMP2436]|nr:hypothetical protein T492DRAFT_635081 [Pavlovales sp. CCMP2436]|mmetsp:Transcript_44689/g.104726  ORF Transcript_44689/g.104726 Transcript_44689/m.104726 type:complete len:294 (+) Transcript_44689:2039-2920(+)
MDFSALLSAERAKRRGAGAPAAHEPAPARAIPAPPPPITLAVRRPLVRDAARGDCALRDVLYHGDFLSRDEENLMRAAVLHPAHQWQQLRGRTSLSFGGQPTSCGFAPEPLPQFCAETVSILLQAGVFPADAPPNHVLVNRYEAGEGILPHSDGPLYDPLVAIISLGGPAALDFWESLQHSVQGRTENGGALPSASFVCEPRSLLVFYGDAYTSFLHGIAERDADPLHTFKSEAVRNTFKSEGGEREVGPPGPTLMLRAPRISLTVRRVPTASNTFRCVAPGLAVGRALDDVI